MELYKTQIIFYNIFLQDNYLGRLMIENAYREFREGDYALVAWFGEYMRILMNRNRAFRFPASRELQVHVGQAMAMADYALRDRQKKLYEFDENVLSMMLSFFRERGETDIYKIRYLQNLYHYDLVNNTELVKTLQCYLQQNLNISETSQALYIARTTCLYRIRRIQEITHLNLEDPETNLYLRLILQLEQGR